MIKALFTGNSSCGFKHDQVYHIRTECKTLGFTGVDKPYLCVYDVNSTAWCPYSSLEIMLKNWTIIQYDASVEDMQSHKEKPAILGRCCVKTKYTNVYYGPSITFGVKGVIVKGTMCDVVSKNDASGWFEVDAKSLDGEHTIVKGWIKKSRVTSRPALFDDLIAERAKQKG